MKITSPMKQKQRIPHNDDSVWGELSFTRAGTEAEAASSNKHVSERLDSKTYSPKKKKEKKKNEQLLVLRHNAGKQGIGVHQYKIVKALE